jgi:hypothetical protein
MSKGTLSAGTGVATQSQADAFVFSRRFDAHDGFREDWTSTFNQFADFLSKAE